MNRLLFFINALIFIGCFYAQSQQLAVSWFLVFGMVFSIVTITWIIGES